MQRLLARVDREDEDNVRVAMEAIGTWDDGTFGSDFRAKIRSLPSTYEIVVSGVRDVSLHVVPRLKGSINFENNSIQLHVKREKALIC